MPWIFPTKYRLRPGTPYLFSMRIEYQLPDKPRSKSVRIVGSICNPVTQERMFQQASYGRKGDCLQYRGEFRMWQFASQKRATNHLEYIQAGSRLLTPSEYARLDDIVYGFRQGNVHSLWEPETREIKYHARSIAPHIPEWANYVDVWWSRHKHAEGMFYLRARRHNDAEVIQVLRKYRTRAMVDYHAAIINHAYGWGAEGPVMPTRPSDDVGEILINGEE